MRWTENEKRRHQALILRVENIELRQQGGNHAVQVPDGILRVTRGWTLDAEGDRMPGNLEWLIESKWSAGREISLDGAFDTYNIEFSAGSARLSGICRMQNVSRGCVLTGNGILKGMDEAGLLPPPLEHYQ